MAMKSGEGPGRNSDLWRGHSRFQSYKETAHKGPARHVCLHIYPDDHRHRLYSGLRGFQVLSRGLCIQVPDLDELVGQLLRTGVRHRSVAGRNANHHRYCVGRRSTHRSRGGNILERLRLDASKESAKAHPGDIGRGTYHRLRLFRPDFRNTVVARRDHTLVCAFAGPLGF